MIEYAHSKGKIKVMLLAHLIEHGQDVGAAMEMSQDCVDAGCVTDFWREQIGKDAADAFNADLDRMKKP